MNNVLSLCEKNSMAKDLMRAATRLWSLTFLSISQDKKSFNAT